MTCLAACGGGHRGNLLGQVGGSHLNHIRDHDGHPDRDRRRRAASRFGLRPTRLAATKDLHHFLGHQHGLPGSRGSRRGIPRRDQVARKRTAQSRGLRFNSTLVSHAAVVLRWFDCAALEGVNCTRDLGSEIHNITAQAV